MTLDYIIKLSQVFHYTVKNNDFKFSRHSRITKFMATTLFDENMGGKYGNTHIALGNAYKDTYTGNIATMTGDGWEAMGFNQCPEVHTDIISTTDRKVTATLPDGQKIVIYENGQFTLV